MSGVLLAAALVPMHLGHLPVWERILVVGIAVVPFIVLGIVIVLVQRRDAAAEAAEVTETAEAAEQAHPARPSE